MDTDFAGVGGSVGLLILVLLLLALHLLAHPPPNLAEVPLVGLIFSYASSSTPHPRQRASRSVIVSDWD